MPAASKSGAATKKYCVNDSPSGSNATTRPEYAARSFCNSAVKHSWQRETSGRCGWRNGTFFLADIDYQEEKSPSMEDAPSDGRIRQACESSGRASSMCAGGKKVADRLRERGFVAFVEFARAQQRIRHIICGASLRVSRILSGARFPASTAISRPIVLRDNQSSCDRCPSGV